VVAVGDQPIGPAHAARHHDIEVVMQAGHGGVRVKEKGQVVDGEQLAPRP
jgi:hypothetical protein